MLVVAFLLVALPLLAGYGTQANWFSPLTGHLYSQEAYNSAVAAAESEGHADGLSEGREIGISLGYEVGYDDGLSDGYQGGWEDGRHDGYDRGWTDGCRSVFNALGTTRVMDFWDYQAGHFYVSYYTTDLCR